MSIETEGAYDSIFDKEGECKARMVSSFDGIFSPESETGVREDVFYIHRTFFSDRRPSWTATILLILIPRDCYGIEISIIRSGTSHREYYFFWIFSYISDPSHKISSMFDDYFTNGIQ